jgi:hypothetical protein
VRLPRDGARGGVQDGLVPQGHLLHRHPGAAGSLGAVDVLNLPDVARA